MLKLNHKQISGDLFGGITASVIALPLALAFGVASGAGAQAGLYGAIVLGLIASIFGGTRVQISGPTGPMTIVAAATLVSFHGDVALLMAAVLLTGVFQILFGLLKIGKFVKYVPYPVISGFMSGIGVIIILLQINPLLGIAGVSSPLQAVAAFTEIGAKMQTEAVWLSLIALAIVFLTPKKLSALIPTPLLALILVTCVAHFGGFEVARIGHIPEGLPQLAWPRFTAAELSIIVTSALSLAVLGSIDSLLTSLVADSISKTEHNSNRELIGQGLGNALTAFAGGIPGAGATMRTVINVKSGGRTRLSGVLHALILLGMLLGLGPFAAAVPMAVLAAILIKVGLDIIDYRFIRIIKQAPKHDLAVMLTVLVLTVFVDLIMAVGVGIVLACLLLTVRVTGQVRSSVENYDVALPAAIEEGSGTDKHCFKIRVINIDGPFFFGSTSRLVAQVGDMLGSRVAIIDCSRVPFIDLSAFFALSETLLKLKEQGIRPLVVADEVIGAKLQRLEIGSVMAADQIHASIDSALEQARSHVRSLTPEEIQFRAGERTNHCSI